MNRPLKDATVKRDHDETHQQRRARLQLFLNADNHAKRLKTRNVQVARVDGDYAYISGGLKNGDRVIVTRLVDPLENILLEIMPQSDKG